MYRVSRITSLNVRSVLGRIIEASPAQSALESIQVQPNEMHDVQTHVTTDRIVCVCVRVRVHACARRQWRFEHVATCLLQLDSARLDSARRDRSPDDSGRTACWLFALSSETNSSRIVQRPFNPAFISAAVQSDALRLVLRLKPSSGS